MNEAPAVRGSLDRPARQDDGRASSAVGPSAALVFGRAIDRHVALLVSFVGVTFVAFRLLVLGRGNVTTALGLLQAAGVGTVLLGTAVTVPGFLLPAVLALSLRGALNARRAGQAAWANGFAATATIAFLLGLVLTPVFLVLGALGWAALPVVLRKRRKPSSALPVAASETPKLTMRDGLVASVALVFGLLLVAVDGWWPTEAVTVKGQGAVTAQVVSDESESIVLLIDGALLRVPAADVKARYFCQEANIRPLGITLWDLVAPVRYPSCPR